MSNNQSNQISRRDFLKTAAVGSAALAGGSLLSGCAAGSSATPSKWDQETDVVVIGFGATGAGAALEAKAAGSDVILLEKMSEEDAGGASTCFGGVIGDIGPEAIIGLSFGRVSMDDATVITKEAAKVLPWLAEQGVEFIENTSIAKNAGVAVYGAFKKAVVAAGITVSYSTPATSLVQDGASGEIRGVKAMKDGKEIYIKARKGVVIASGGYSANNELVNMLNYPGLKVTTTSSPAETGDGLLMGLAAGAKLSNVALGYEFCEVAFRKASEEAGTGVPNQRWVALDWYTGTDSDYLNDSEIFVNAAGQRFMNEKAMVTHDKSPIPLLNFAGALFDNPKGYKNQPFFMICDDDCIKSGPLASPNMNWSWNGVKGKYTWSKDNQAEIEKGWIVKANTLEELAAGLKGSDWYGNEVAIDPAGLKAAVDEYNASCTAGVDNKFGKPANRLKPIIKAPFYGVELMMNALYTLGGLISDVKGRTLDGSGQPIARLYSAGNVGQPTVLSPIGINGCVACGRLAGRDVAALKNWG